MSTSNLPNIDDGLAEAENVSWKAKSADSRVYPLDTFRGKDVEARDHKPLVGAGPKADPIRRRPRLPRRSGSQAAATSALRSAHAVRSSPASTVARPAAESQDARRHAHAMLDHVLVKPPLRKFAKDLGIDLSKVRGTGDFGQVTREDVISYQAQCEAAQSARPVWVPQSAQDDRTERIPVEGVRKAAAQALVESAFTAPHVSIFVDVDVSRTLEFVQQLKKNRDFEGLKVSPLLILAKAVIWAAARNPNVNASWVHTDNGDEIQVKHYINLGITAATPRGLLVPNIKDAQNLGLKELAIALRDLAATARDGKTKPSNMQGGTISITNIGALGIDTGTSINNPGEVAIVTFGTIRQKPWVVSGNVIPRWITTLGVSFDHRVIDGDLSAKFMTDVAAIIEEPARLLA